MKFYRFRTLLLLPLALAMLSAGCATNRPEVNTWRDPQFSPAPTNTFALTIRTNPSPQDAELGRILVAELKREGFDLVPMDQADYLITYAVEDDWKVNHFLMYQPDAPILPPISPATGQSAPLESKTSGVPKAIVRHNKGIRLYLYTNPKTHPGGLQIVWQGDISAGQKVSAECAPALIGTLLDYLGRNENGRVNLVK